MGPSLQSSYVRNPGWYETDPSADPFGVGLAPDLLSGQLLWSRELGFFTLGVAWGPALDLAPA